MRVLAAVTAASALLAAPAPITVTAAGRIGPVQLGHSTRADLLKLATPNAETHTARFDALGYGCKTRRAANAVGVPLCRTVVYATSKSGVLEEFATSDPRFVGPGGVRVGMTNAAAARALHRTLPATGCQPQFFVPRWQSGGFLAVVLGPKRVASLVLIGPRRFGIFDCIDS